MTRDELIEKVARSICKFTYGDDNDDVWHTFTDEAIAAIDTVFASMKEPSEIMSIAGCKADDPLGELVDWNGDNCTTREAVNTVWQAMISASPLAPEGGRE